MPRQELIDHVLKNTKEKSLDDYEGDDEVDGNRQIPTLSQVGIYWIRLDWIRLA